MILFLSYHRVIESTDLTPPLSGCWKHVRGNLAPIIGFLRKALYRSCTPGFTLQIAFRYFEGEVIHPKVPDPVGTE